MFAKRLLQKAIHHHHHHQNLSGGVTSADVDVRTILHYGVPSTASILAFDPIQRLLAIGTLDGRIKVVGGNNIEGLLVSPKQLPYKYLEFLQNQGSLISISNENEIQVWNLQSRCISSTLQWESNITAFSILMGSHFMYVGDEYGIISVLKYDADHGELLQFPYNICSRSLQEAAGLSFLSHQLIVGVLPQPCSSGSRVVIAYESGLIILWEIVEAQIITIWGDRILQLKDEVDPPRETEASLEDDKHQHLEEKEISALCWASSDGTILAVGYVDGDILFWRTSIVASKKSQQAELSRDVVKLQLSSAEKRLPIIALQWWENDKSRHDGDGQILIYGGDEIGGDEFVTVLRLEWASGMENLKCLGRVDLKLSGSFADAILLPTAGTMGRYENAALFVLTNPGKLQVFDCASLSSSVLPKEKNFPVSSLDFPAVIPTIDPCMTVSKLFSLPTAGNLSQALAEVAALKKFNTISNLPNGAKNWFLTGGVLNHLLISKDERTERVYVAGYQDGSVRIWNATYPVLSLLCVIDSEIKGINLAGSSAPVSKVDICFQSLTLAVGNESGLVYLHSLNSRDETSFHFVTENKSEVHSFPQVEGPNCRAVFGLLDSRIQALEFSKTGAKLVVGYECARIAVLDTKSLSTVFLTDNISSSTSLLVSVVWKDYLQSQVKKLNHAGSKLPDDHVEEYIFILTDDSRLYVVNGSVGNMISSRPMHLKKQSTAISMHVIESRTAVARRLNGNLAQHSSSDDVAGDEPPRDITARESPKSETECCSSECNSSADCLKNSYLLLCCTNAVRVFTMKSVIQGDSKSICKIKLAKPCCWTTTFAKDEEDHGLVLLYQTGDIEIRSLPDLELVKEFSLMSALRWNFKAKMERTVSASGNGHIVLVHGCEVALISILASENDFRIPESLPGLHDEVLAAASKAAMSVSSYHKKKQGIGLGILGGIVKGLKGGKLKNSLDCASTFSHLEGIFMKNPFPELSTTSAEKQEDAELSIDDIEIDDTPVPLTATSSHEVQKNEKGIKSDREKLLDDGGTEAKPRLRTPEEIIATYRRTEDASSAAGQARNKLLERQEKLERISKRTEELRSGAEDFASLANELVKEMEKRQKWWQI